MVVQLDKRRWQTKPLDCWKKLKEGTRTHWVNEGKEKEGRELICYTIAGQFAQPMARLINGHPYGAQIAGAGLSAEYCEAAEARGYSRDLCAYGRIDLGGMFLHKYAFGDEFPEPDFIIAHAGWCDAGQKQLPPQAEYCKVPFFVYGRVQIYNDFDSEQTIKNKIEYRVASTLEGIEWLEKVTGREFDDEAYIQHLYDSSRIRNLRSQILILNQNIPAPLDEKTMFSVLNAARETVDVTQMLRDEVEDRVRNQIAAVGTERFRVMTYGIPPYYALNIYRYMEQYGIVSIGSRYLFNNCADTCLTAGGIEIPIPSLQQRGIVLKTREDAVRVAVENLADRPGWHYRFGGHAGNEYQLRMARLWHCDGLVMHYNRGCWPLTMWAPVVRLAFLENGIPVATYEGNHADPRDWDEARVLARLDAFAESQGLEKVV